MAWEDLESKLLQLENRLSEAEKTMRTVPAEEMVYTVPSFRDYWRMRLVEERMLWERRLERERNEKALLSEQVEQHRIKIRELEYRVEQLNIEINQQRQLWEERLKTKEAEYKLAIKMREEELRLEQAVAPYPVSRGYAGDLELLEKKKDLEHQLEKIESERIQEKRKWDEEREKLEKRIFEAEKIWQEKLNEEMRKIDHQLRKEYEETLVLHEQAHLFTTEEMARGFAHRLRNSVGIISGLVQLVLSDPAIRGGLKENLENVVKTIDELIIQIEDFVKLTYIPEMVLQPLPINPLLERLLDEIEPKCKEQNIQIVKNLQANLPPVEIDAHLFEEGLLNILINAIEAMPTGGTLTVETDPDKAKKEVVIKITDMGVGIPEHQLSKVYQSFFTTKKGAKGLGLSRARRIIDLHHGLIKIESVKDKGTTVTIRLPAVLE